MEPCYMAHLYSKRTGPCLPPARPASQQKTSPLDPLKRIKDSDRAQTHVQLLPKQSASAKTPKHLGGSTATQETLALSLGEKRKEVDLVWVDLKSLKGIWLFFNKHFDSWATPLKSSYQGLPLSSLDWPTAWDGQHLDGLKKKQQGPQAFASKGEISLDSHWIHKQNGQANQTVKEKNPQSTRKSTGSSHWDQGLPKRSEAPLVLPPNKRLWGAMLAILASHLSKTSGKLLRFLCCTLEKVIDFVHEVM